MSAAELVGAAKRGIFEITRLYDGEEFVGYFAVMPDSSLVYLFFLAIDKEKRSKGYGKAALELLKEMYKGRRLIVDLEAVDENADNSEQRKRRRAFYIKNGFTETGCFLDYNAVKLEVLGDGPDFDKTVFEGLLENVRKMGMRVRVLSE